MVQIVQTEQLQKQRELSELAANTNKNLEDEFGSSTDSVATWDLVTDEAGRFVFELSFRDPWGYASAHFAPDELRAGANLQPRLHRLRGDLLQSVRRSRLPLRDTFASAEQLESLRQALTQIPGIANRNLKLLNRVELVPSEPGRFLIRDFVIEVEEPAAELVKRAVQGSGFVLRGESLHDNPKVRDAVVKLVEAHLRDPLAPPRYAIWFQLQDPSDVHLLEISDEVEDFGSGSLEGIALGAGSAVPGARSIVIYLTSPAELRKAFDVNPGHPAVQSLQTRRCDVIYPPDGFNKLRAEFPEIG